MKRKTFCFLKRSNKKYMKWYCNFDVSQQLFSQNCWWESGKDLSYLNEKIDTSFFDDWEYDINSFLDSQKMADNVSKENRVWEISNIKESNINRYAK